MKAKATPDQHLQSTTYHQDQLFATPITKQSNPTNTLCELSVKVATINNCQQNQRKIAVDGRLPTARYYPHLNRKRRKTMPTNTCQNEAILFFQIASELRRAERECADPAAMAELIDEVDAMRQHSSSALIRGRCSDLLRQHENLKAGPAS
ncbi:hypothetical protein NKI88_12205 [Mesorhizobium sp. M0317]|uniref:hypothetical protein n=1 Tax=Mesorhizobium sp. M0317 TaxID=2956935 RepID=UPI003339CDE1